MRWETINSKIACGLEMPCSTLPLLHQKYYWASFQVNAMKSLPITWWLRPALYTGSTRLPVTIVISKQVNSNSKHYQNISKKLSDIAFNLAQVLEIPPIKLLFVKLISENRQLIHCRSVYRHLSSVCWEFTIKNVSRFTRGREGL